MKFLYLGMIAWTLVACDNGVTSKSEIATQTKQGSADNAPSASSLESDSSEGVVGPDDAYFAGVYLESVFKVSKANPNPSLDSSLSLGSEKVVEAFDFAANLQPKRLGLMSRILMSLGDKDKNSSLSLEEFQSIQLLPELLGANEAMSHDFGKELFDNVAGEDDLLSHEEIKVLLTRVASQIQLAKLSKKEFRQSLEEGWEKILAAFDEDKDGKMSMAEQRKLRKERASILGRFAAD